MRKYECTYRYVVLIIAPDKETAKVLFLSHLAEDYNEAVMQRIEETIECREVEDEK